MNRSFSIVARPDRLSQELAEKTGNLLEKAGCHREDKNPDTVFVIGGDGTFIYAVHAYLDSLDHVKFYGLHTGTLGFYSDYRDDDFEEYIREWLDGKNTEVIYPMLEAQCECGTFYGINEIRVENASRTQNMSVSINGELFEEYRGTGLCIATQLGSTAYNRSLGGAVVEEGLAIIQMCEISGIHHNKYRSLGAPLIMKDDSVIVLESASFKGALLGADSDVASLDDVHKITIFRSLNKQVHLLRSGRITYFDRLNSLF